MLENHGQPWTETHINTLRSKNRLLKKQLKCAIRHHRKEVFKEWLRDTSAVLGRKEEAVMAKMVSLGLLIPRIAKTNYHKENVVSDIFKKYPGHEIWEALFENLQKDEEPDYNIRFLSDEYIAPSAFINGGTLFMASASIGHTNSIRDYLINDIINTEKIVKKMQKIIDEQKTQIKAEIQSIKDLQAVMSAHSLKYPNSSVESFGLQYSKLLARRSELERVLKNI